MNPSKPSVKTEILPILAVVISIFLSFYFYSRFPETVPTHWNVAGEPDDWSSRAVGAFAIPGVIAGMYLMFLFLPFLDPKKERYAQFAKVYHIFKTLIITVMLAIYVIASLNILGYPLKIDFWIPFIIGLLFIFLGNYFGKLKPNWFMGIRTPWTLSSETVWHKTHRFGGKIFVLSGFIMMLLYFLPPTIRIWTFSLMLAMIFSGTILYSYIIYKKEKKNENNHQLG